MAAAIDYSKLLQDTTLSPQARQAYLALRAEKIAKDPSLAKYADDDLSREYKDLMASQTQPQVDRTQIQPSMQPQMMDAKQLASMFGDIKYNQDEIRGLFDNATRAEYAMKDKEFANTENLFSRNMYDSSVLAQDALRKNTAAAITTGASRGMQAANELSAILGLQQESSAGATELAQERNLLKDSEAAAYSKNAERALTTANDTGLKLGQLGQGFYAADVQYSAAEMAALAQLAAAQKQLEGVGITADANRDVANIGAEGNLAVQREANAGSLASTNAQGGWNLKVAQENGAAQRDAASTSAAGQVEAARYGYLGQQSIAGAMAGQALTSERIAKLQTIGGQLDDMVKNGNVRGALTLIMNATGATQEEAQAILDAGNAGFAAAARPKQTGASSTAGTDPYTGVPTASIQMLEEAVNNELAHYEKKNIDYGNTNIFNFDNWFTHYVGLGYTPQEATAVARQLVDEQTFYNANKKSSVK